MKMSTCTHETMTNRHQSGLLTQLGETLHTWRDRARQRRELGQRTDRDPHDVGLSWGDIAEEGGKPVWRGWTKQKRDPQRWGAGARPPSPRGTLPKTL